MRNCDILTILTALEKTGPEAKGLCLSSTDRMREELMRQVQKATAHIQGIRTNHATHEVTLANGAVMRFRTNEDWDNQTLAGQRFSLVILDEKTKTEANL